MWLSKRKKSTVLFLEFSQSIATADMSLSPSSQENFTENICISYVAY